MSRKRERSQLDFDDLLLYWRAALVDERIGPQLASLFDHVLVDEYQDVNALQVDIVRLLAPAGRGLTVVGDDAQAIYGFRGADACHLHELARSLEGASVIRLERNFRSFQPILDVANLVRPPASTGDERLMLHSVRPGGRRPVLVRCYDAGGEARAVVDRILELQEQGMRLRDQAVLVRAAYHSDLVELELTARRVPYRKYGGLRFVEAAHVKDYVAAVRLLDNPSDDIAWFRLLRLHEGIGPGRARQLLETLPPRRPEAVHDWAATVAAAPPMARVPLGQTLAALCESRAITSGGPGRRADRLLELVRPLVAGRYHDSAARIGDLERLAAAAGAAHDLGDWLAEITLDPPVSSGDHAGPPHVDDDFVVVSTVHSAKGLEWLVVHLAHLVDGAFPSDMAPAHAGRPRGGATPLLRGDDEGTRRAQAVRALADAPPPAGPRRQAHLGAGEPVSRRSCPRRAQGGGPGPSPTACGGGRRCPIGCEHRSCHRRPRRLVVAGPPAVRDFVVSG